jgi:putative membrane protein
MSLLIPFITTCLTVAASVAILPGVHAQSWVTIVLVAVVLGLINTFIKPILVIISLPVTLVTLGLFLIVINAALVLLTAAIVPGFVVDGWLSAILFSLLVSLVGSVLSKLVK